MRRSRFLKPSEARLWAAITAEVRPLAGPGRAAPVRLPLQPAEPLPAVPPPPAEPPRAAPPRTPAAPPPRPAAKPLVPLDAKTRRAVSRGRVRPEATLDLHGMRQDEAHAALVRFLLGAQRNGLRLVGIVTGKGREGGADPFERGVLRRSVPHWLALPVLRPIVLGWTEAAPHRGGAGALVVRLRAGRGA